MAAVNTIWLTSAKMLSKGLNKDLKFLENVNKTLDPPLETFLCQEIQDASRAFHQVSLGTGSFEEN